MTKKDYIKLAEVLNHRLYFVLGDDKYNERMTLYATMREIASMLSSDNPRFNYRKFLNACGMPEDMQ